MSHVRNEVQESYDRVAEEYARQFFGELAHKPFDRDLLTRFAHRLRDAGPVCDLGCGPGQIARFLKDHGVDALGMDLSPEMVTTASRLSPDIPFLQGDMRALPVPDAAWAGIAAFYAIVNIPRDELAPVMCELHRVLRPNGLLLLSFHVGTEVIHREELWGQSVCLDFFFLSMEEVLGFLRSAAFEIEEALERQPYAEVEYPSRRGYILARKPFAASTTAESRSHPVSS
jgi:ubiquinone/menaquinone biosynthesis C-methylase UbiE